MELFSIKTFMNLFDKDILLDDLGNSHFAGVVTDNWSVNGNPDGGYLMTLIANAMIQKSDKKNTPTVTANYLARCVPGEVDINISEISRSRQFNRFEARLSQKGEAKIIALGTFVSENDVCEIERYETKEPDLSPVEECIQIPVMPKFTLFQNLDLRLDPTCAGWMTGKLTDVSQNKGYLSFRDGRPIDLLSLFLIIDSIPPAVFATQGITAWVPTIELSVNIRNLPKTDRLKCSLRTRFITCGLLEADGELWDEKGNLAAISRQIAQFRKM
ncbi:MAG: thioesterase family protein [Smithella sp.]